MSGCGASGNTLGFRRSMFEMHQIRTRNSIRSHNLEVRGASKYITKAK